MREKRHQQRSTSFLLTVSWGLFGMWAFLDSIVLGANGFSKCRNEIASCEETAYESLPLKDAATLLFFKSQSELLIFAQQVRVLFMALSRRAGSHSIPYVSARLADKPNRGERFIRPQRRRTVGNTQGETHRRVFSLCSRVGADRIVFALHFPMVTPNRYNICCDSKTETETTTTTRNSPNSLVLSAQLPSAGLLVQGGARRSFRRRSTTSQARIPFLSHRRARGIYCSLKSSVSRPLQEVVWIVHSCSFHDSFPRGQF